MIFFHMMDSFCLPVEYFLPIEYEVYYLNDSLFDEDEHIEFKRWKRNSDLCNDKNATGKSFTLEDQSGIKMDIVVNEEIELTLLEEIFYGMERKYSVTGKIRRDDSMEISGLELAIMAYQNITLFSTDLTIDYKLALFEKAINNIIDLFVDHNKHQLKTKNNIIDIKDHSPKNAVPSNFY